MNRTTLLFLLLTLIILVAGVFGYQKYREIQREQSVESFEQCVALGYPVMESYPPQCRAGGKLFVQEVPIDDAIDDPVAPDDSPVRILEPVRNQVVQSPLIVRGEARGNWYFEASFPVVLIDANGAELVRVPAQAQGEWMTTEFVPFEVTLNFITPATTTGTLIFEKDNPSGLPENAQRVTIPVRFRDPAASSTTAEMRTVKLYYYDQNKDKDENGNIMCSKNGLVAVERKIPQTVSPLHDTLQLLIKGERTLEEKERGVTTEFPLEGLLFKGVVLNEDELILLFYDPQNKTVGGACRVNILRAQIEETARQFENFSSVRYKPEELFQP